MAKYTAIYTERIQTGSHSNTLVCYRRIETLPGETPKDMLDREELGDGITVYLFHGHAMLEGEHATIGPQ